MTVGSGRLCTVLGNEPLGLLPRTWPALGSEVPSTSRRQAVSVLHTRASPGPEWEVTFWFQGTTPQVPSSAAADSASWYWEVKGSLGLLWSPLPTHRHPRVCACRRNSRHVIPSPPSTTCYRGAVTVWNPIQKSANVPLSFLFLQAVLPKSLTLRIWSLPVQDEEVELGLNLWGVWVSW